MEQRSAGPSLTYMRTKEHSPEPVPLVMCSWALAVHASSAGLLLEKDSKPSKRSKQMIAMGRLMGGSSRKRRLHVCKVGLQTVVLLFGSYVAEVCSEHVWVALAAGERGLLSAVESSADPQEIADCSSRFSVGQALACRVIEARPPSHPAHLRYQADWQPFLRDRSSELLSACMFAAVMAQSLHQQLLRHVKYIERE